VLKRSDRLGQLLHGSDASPVILCGHVHRPYFAHWNGANCFVGGSPARAFAADPPFGAAPIQPSEEPFSYFVHKLKGNGDHVVTPRWLGM
jgi:predicted phosphodiesterase